MLNRRQFLKQVGLGAVVGALGWPGPPPTAWGQPMPMGRQTVRVALLADPHLPNADPKTAAARSFLGAVEEIKAMSPPVDMVLLAGDLSDNGGAGALGLGREILEASGRPYWATPGEKDMAAGRSWRKYFGTGTFCFWQQGVQFGGLETTAAQTTAGRAVFSLEPAQISWLAAALRQGPPEAPLVLLTHGPLYDLFRPWEWWTAGAAALHDLLGQRQRVLLVHGHVHQNIPMVGGHLTFQGLRSTAWPWPEVQMGTPAALPEPGIIGRQTGCGWHLLTIDAQGGARLEDRLWTV